MKAKVVITDFIAEPLDIERRVLGNVADVSALNALDEDDLAGQVEDAEVIVLYHQLSITRKTIDRLRRCRLIIRGGVGFDNVDRAAARERGIVVCNVPDYGTEDVADSAIGMMMSLARGIHLLNSRLRRGEGEWHFSQAAPVWRLRDRVFGIVGMGRIGMAAALRAKALGMRVMFHDPHVPQGRDKALGIMAARSLEELLTQSNIVSLHCPQSEETAHLINEHTLALLPPGAILINTARGGVVDPLALLHAIERSHLAGAGIDVLEAEPPDNADPLIQAWRDPAHPAHDRLIINPHSAFYSEEGLADMRAKSSENALRVLTGLPPWNVVNE